MLETIFKSQRKLEIVRKSSLREHINEYLAHLESLRYRRITIKRYACILLRFAEFLDKQGEYHIRDLPKWIDPFLRLPQKKYYRRAKLIIIGPFVRHLQNKGVVRSSPVVTESLRQKTLREYETYLREKLNLAEDSIVCARHYCAKFLDHIDTVGIKDLRDLKPKIVQQFIQNGHEKLSKSSICCRYWASKKYISYLKTLGVIQMDFSDVLIAPRIYQHQYYPRLLTREEIHAMLSSIDRRTSIGKRDYAMILLLSTYGLRGGEVVKIRLEDIEWRTDLLHIRGRKAGNNSVYPLTVSVGESILSYLKRARPPNRHRQIFLSCKAPHNPLTRSAITAAVKKYLSRAGLGTDRRSSHTFRYSCAQRLFDDEFSMKVIADYLGHRDLRSTQRYMKIDLRHLREVAMNSSEDLL
jgi:site-specific recombinase XerD